MCLSSAQVFSYLFLFCRNLSCPCLQSFLLPITLEWESQGAAFSVEVFKLQFVLADCVVEAAFPVGLIQYFGPEQLRGWRCAERHIWKCRGDHSLHPGTAQGKSDGDPVLSVAGKIQSRR